MIINARTQPAPETGRKTIQLTQGNAFCYPLYYYIPSFSRDSRYLMHHRAENGQVQIHRLDLQTGESLQLTHATTPNSQWVPWCSSSGSGVLDHLSVLNVVRDELIYFDSNQARCVGLNGKEDRLLFTLPADRMAMGQNCVSFDGQWFVYIHHDRESFSRVYPGGNRQHSRGTVLAAFHLDTGEQRDLVVINSPIHHVLPYGENQFVFCHPATESGMLITDINGGWYTHLRTQDPQGGNVCHYLTTAEGIAYEIAGRKDSVWAGMYDPATHRRFELPLPAHFGYTHTGWDPQGQLWFFESEKPEPWVEHDASKRMHDLWFLARHRPDGEDEWLRLFGNWPAFGGGQKAHFHPQVTPDRRWILLTAGAPSSQTNRVLPVSGFDLLRAFRISHSSPKRGDDEVESRTEYIDQRGPDRACSDRISAMASRA